MHTNNLNNIGFLQPNKIDAKFIELFNRKDLTIIAILFWVSGKILMN